MLVNHLLFTFAVNHYGKIIKAANHPAKLKSVYQIDGDGNRFFANLVEKCILNVDGLFQNPYLLCNFNILHYCTLFSSQMALSCNQALNFCKTFPIRHIEPVHLPITAKPRQLAFGVLARTLLNQMHRFLQC
jgi:hypothetical protein